MANYRGPWPVGGRNPLPAEVEDEIIRRLKEGETVRGIAREMGVSRSAVGLRRRRLQGKDVLANRTRKKFSKDRYRYTPTESEAVGDLWERVLDTAIRDGDLVWLYHHVDNAETIGTFTWVAISLGAEPEYLLEGIHCGDRRTPVFPRHGDGSVILWDWTEHDATEERIEERDTAGCGGGDVAGPEAPGVERAGVRGCDGRPRWDEGGRQDAGSVGA